MRKRQTHYIQQTSTFNFDKALYIPVELQDKVTLWMLRIIVKLGAYREFVDSHSGFRTDNLALFFGLEEFVNDDEFDKHEPIKILKKKLTQLEKKKTLGVAKTLSKNISRLSSLMNLNKHEEQILEFVILLHQYDLLDNCADLLGNDLNSGQILRILSVTLNIPQKEINKIFRSDSKFSKSSIVALYKRGTNDLKNKLETIGDEFTDNMLNMDEEIEVMIKEAVRPCDTAMLCMDDYEHIKEDLDILVPYLETSLQTKETGVNILFYGKPGTGKTELAKTLSKEVGANLHEVSYADNDDEPIDGQQRLKAYKIAQTILGSQHTMLVYDEAEDIFESHESFFTPKRQKDKAWINKILESNLIPTIWITNNIKSIDAAIVRRFDLAIEVPIPKKSKRQEIIRHYSGNLLDETSIVKLAQNKNIAPALISRAAKVLQSVKSSTTDTSKAFEHIVNNTLNAQGYGSIKQIDETALPSTYNPAYVNTTADLQKMAEGIKANPNARLCLYGVPGTGKSAFGKWIADITERPFLLKKGSDLISMWVGGTEENIANAFKEASDEGAVLVFDEVDSFLQDRRSAKQSWEVTQVNEMLVQMENFNGIFIATTNLMDGLDQASLRRFDLKLEFGYLKREQAWKLFLDEAKQLKLRKPANKVQNELRKLSNLAPGDFAAVRRQHRFNPIANAMDLVERLKDECSVKEDNQERKMGFVA